MNSNCPGCGNKITDSNRFCMFCGYNLNTIDQYKQDSNSNVSVGSNQPTASKVSNGIGIAGFVVSLISLIMCCGSFSWLSLIFSILGIKKAKKNNGVGHGLSLAGIIISAIGLLIFLFWFFSIVVALIKLISLGNIVR